MSEGHRAQSTAWGTESPPSSLTLQDHAEGAVHRQDAGGCVREGESVPPPVQAPLLHLDQLPPTCGLRSGERVLISEEQEVGAWSLQQREPQASVVASAARRRVGEQSERPGPCWRGLCVLIFFQSLWLL